MSRNVGTALAIVAAVLATASHVATSAQRPFTVVDSVEMRHVVPIEREALAVHWNAVLFSPGGSRFIVRLQKGDIATDSVAEELLEFSVADVKRYLEKGASASPKPLLLTTNKAPVASAQLFGIEWLDERTVGFIATSEDGTQQVFSADAVTGERSQLTRHPRDVSAFVVSGKRILYAARVASANEGPLVGHDEWLGELLVSEPDSTYRYPLIDWNVDTLAGGSRRRIDAPVSRMRKHMLGLWMSPSGRYALTTAPATNAPLHWQEYNVIRPGVHGFFPDRATADPTSVQMQNRVRYQLIDLVSGATRPLLDAPTGLLAQNFTPVAAFWPRGRSSVIVTNAFLPLLPVSDAERAQRASGPAIAEVDVDTGEISVIAWEPTRSGDRKNWETIVAVDWDDPAQVISIHTRTASGSERVDSYRRSTGAWKQVRTPRAERRASIEVKIRQDLNRRPVLAVSGGRCACEKVLFDPAPSADEFTFGRVELRRWTDRNGNSWQGGVAYPPGFDSRKRYPLVVQTHGFDPEAFLIDGSRIGTAGSAAQALANAGFVVLQVEDNTVADAGTRDGARRYAEGYRAAIESLVSAGYVDADKVGLTAYSITGLPALALLASEPQLLRAANLVDANLLGYTAILAMVNASPDTHAMARAAWGQKFTQENLCEFLQPNPIYHLKEVTSAVRIEAFSASSAVGMWETYALLRYRRQPADFIFQPDALHRLVRPSQRLVNLNGTLDWFRFWLQGFEDPDPAKKEQYERWHSLRADRERLLDQAPAAAPASLPPDASTE